MQHLAPVSGNFHNHRISLNSSYPWIVPAPVIWLKLNEINPALEYPPHHARARWSWWAWLSVQLFDLPSCASICSKTCWNRYLQWLNCTVWVYYVDLSQSSTDFTFIWAKSARSAAHIRARKCCNINLPALVLFLPLNCIRMLAHSEINSTFGKNSRKYGTMINFVLKICCSSNPIQY